MELKNIVGEYHSKNIIIKQLFFKRLENAIALVSVKLNNQSQQTPSVIDIGCGEGLLLKLLQKKFSNIKMFGVDIEPNVKRLENSIPAEICIASITNTNLPEHSFDVAFCLDILEHLTEKELKVAIEEIKRILKPDGLLITSLPTENWFYKLCRFFEKGTISTIKGPGVSPHLHNAKEVECVLLSSGFRIVQQKRIPGLPLISLFHITSFTLSF